MPRIARAAVIDDAGAGFGAQALDADHGTPLQRFAVGAYYGNPVRAVFVAVHLAFFEAEGILLPARLD